MNSKYISDRFQQQLLKVLNSNFVSFEILYSLKDSDTLPEGWNVKIINSADPIRNYPLGKSMGYLNFPEDKKLEILQDFESFIHQQIESSKYTIEGIANILIICERLGQINSEELYDLISKLIINLDQSDFQKVLNIIIQELNNIFTNKSDSEYFEPKTLKDWEYLYLKSQYVEMFENPIELLIKLVYIRISQVDLFSILIKLLPEPRAFFVEWRLTPDNEISSSDLIDILKDNICEAPFIGSLIFNMSEKSPIWISKELLLYLLKEHWDTTGKYILRKTFLENNKLISERIVKLLFEGINEFLTIQFCGKENENTVLKQFDWPYDYEAFGGWIEYAKTDIKTSNNFTNNFVEELSSGFNSVLNCIQNNIPNYIASSADIYQKWFSNIYDIKAQNIITYCLWSWLLCKEENWIRCKKTFENLCYKLKMLFYGSFEANHLGQRLCNQVLIFVLALPKFENYKIQNDNRLDDLIKIVTDTFLFSYIRFTEREEFIWNTKNYVPNYYSDLDLSFVINRLKSFKASDYLKFLKPIYEKIGEYKTIEWPI